MDAGAGADHWHPPQIPIQTIRAAYTEIGQRVNIALRTQIGDAARLGAQRNECLRLLTLVGQHADLFSAEEGATIETSVHSMISHLDEATRHSSDPAETPPLTITRTVRTGGQGRPRYELDPAVLRAGLQLRGPTGLAPVFDVAPRTIRRRALEHGFVQPGPPVFVDYIAEDGSTTRIYTSSTAPTSDLSDEELDEITEQVLELFPNFGRRMLDGHFRFLGHHVPRSRILESYARVHGAPTTMFGARRIQRRVYSVPGPNSLYHHDGQHALIQYRLVIHTFVDGFSRFVTGICVSDNNRADTVLDLFLDIIDEHGVPSRVRGDHGTENLRVAEWMENLGVLNEVHIYGGAVYTTFASNVSGMM